MLSWMAWTAPTAGLFVGIFALLAVMATWGRYSPPVARRGFLGFDTDRGDRLYVALISIALFLVLWIALTDASLWGALAVSGVIGGIILRWA